MLFLADGSRFDHPNLIADLADIRFVMRLQLSDPTQHLPVHRMDDRPLDGDDHSLIHLIAQHTANPLPLLHCTFCHSHDPLTFASCRDTSVMTVLTLAMSRLVFRICMGFSSRPVPN